MSRERSIAGTTRPMATGDSNGMSTPRQTGKTVMGAMAAMMFAVSGCATTAGGLGDESGPERLPRGITFLDSFERQCAGTLHVGEDSVASSGLHDAHFVDPGNNAAFRVAGTPIRWACIDGEERTYDNVTCPRATSHVRFTRALDGERVLIECFG